MNKPVFALVVMALTACSSSFSEAAFHKMLDEADEVAKECAIYKREVACNKAVNKLTRLVEYINENDSEASKHFKSHPFDLQKLQSIQTSTGSFK